MEYITRHCVKSEYHNTYFTKKFKIVDNLPEINSEIIDDYEGTHTVITGIYKLSHSYFTGDDKAYDGGWYDYYRIDKTITDIIFDDTDTDSEYVAVWNSYDDVTED